MRGAGWSNGAGTRLASHKDRGCTIRGKEGTATSVGSRSPSGGAGEARCAQSVGRREGGVGCRERAAGQAGGSPGAPGPAGAKPPGRRQGARETHGVEQVERAEAVLGTREASANHLGACGSRQLQVHGAPAREQASLSVPSGPGRAGRAARTLAGGPGAGGAVRGAPRAAATRSGTCGRSSWSPNPAQRPRLAPRADWPPAGNKGRDMQMSALSQSGSGRGGAALGAGEEAAAGAGDSASRWFPGEQVRRGGRGWMGIRAGPEAPDSSSQV